MRLEGKHKNLKTNANRVQAPVIKLCQLDVYWRWSGMRLRGSNLVAWWYLTIALAFTLLAADRILRGQAAWLIGVRLAIAAGFGALAVMEFKGR